MSVRWRRETLILDSSCSLSGFRVVTGAGGELETDFSYSVIRQLFGPAVADDDRKAEDLFVGAAALARPVLALEAARDGPPQAGDSYALKALHGLYWLTVNLAARAPLLIAVDDVH